MNISIPLEIHLSEDVVVLEVQLLIYSRVLIILNDMWRGLKNKGSVGLVQKRQEAERSLRTKPSVMTTLHVCQRLWCKKYAWYQAQTDKFLTASKPAGVLEKARPNGYIVRYNLAPMSLVSYQVGEVAARTISLIQ
ncbi:hypothetical protein QZH47_05725 [Pseudomonas corrugata]